MKNTMTINQFGDLLYDVLWVKKSKNKKIVKELENLIINKTKFDFTKEEFIDGYLFTDTDLGDGDILSFRPREQYDEISDFILTFFEDSYEAVTFKSTGHQTVIALKLIISDFHLLIQEKYKQL
jgi:hypothetical protein